MKTILHSYLFDTSKTEERLAWQELRARLKATHPHRMKSHGGASHYRPELDGCEIELETASLFDNQWNTAPIAGISENGLRVFDWAQDYMTDSWRQNIKRGHYLDQTSEMIAARADTLKCGYCGAQSAAEVSRVFCGSCIDSAYLTEKDLYLTRLVPVCDTSKPRAPLTDAERAELLPRFTAAQIHGSTVRGKARMAKRRADIETKFTQTVANATTERDAARFLIDRAPAMLENWIFYSHTGRHCFGWRKPLDASTLSALLDIVSEFPFAYDIKTADGRTLSGE